MIGMIVVTHASLAQELLNTAAMIVGPIECSRAVSIDQGMSLDAAKAALQSAIEDVNPDGDGVIILTDLFGGTPTNISADFLGRGDIEILTGVNLPMVLKCSSGRTQCALGTLAETLRDYARTAVIRPSELFKTT